MDAKEHYAAHLASFYSWMVGDFEAARSLLSAYFQTHGVYPHGSGLALDLGAGTGLQTVALAHAGFHVLAIDFDAHLLHELRARTLGLPVTAFEQDLQHFEQLLTNEAPELIVCMGDTLTHLPTTDTLAALLVACQRASAQGGKLVLSFRPLAQELHDTQRFIPVRSDINRIHTCVLEYFPTTVRVTDLLHERTTAGEWSQIASSYHKLRLSVADVVTLLEQAQWHVINQETQRGMVYLLAQRN